MIKQFGMRASLERAHMEELFRLTEVKERDENPHKEIQPIAEDQTDWPHFSQVFQTSATESIGIDKLKQFFLETAYPNPWLYNRDLITNKNPAQVIVNIIKSKILDHVAPGPTPYNLNIKIVDWIVKESSIEIIAKCSAENNFYIRQMIGPKGKIIFTINNQVREALSRLYRCEVNFRLDLKYNEVNDDRKEKNERKNRNDQNDRNDKRSKSGGKEKKRYFKVAEKPNLNLI